MTTTLKDIKTTVAVDGMPKCNVYTAAAALDRAREEQAANPAAKVTIYQWDNLTYVYNPETDSAESEKIVKVHTCEIRDNNGNKIAVRYFRTHDEAVAEQNRLLSYEWVGYMAAPIVSAYETTPKALEELVRTTNAKIGEGE